MPTYQVVQLVETFEAGADYLAAEKFIERFEERFGDQLKLVRPTSMDIVSGIPIEDAEYLYVVRRTEGGEAST